MWAIISVSFIIGVLFVANNLFNKWLNMPGADFNKQYDKTIL